MEIQAHGALIDVLDVGVLLLGKSGVGKSECALELVSRGHRLVADDVVRIRSVPGETGEPGTLVGQAPERIRHYMEIRGIGLLYIPELYGADSVRAEATIDLLCRLEVWQEGVEYERIGLERPRELLAGVSVPVFDGGAGKAQVRAQEAALEQARAAHRAAVLVALKDVEDALVALQGERERQASLRNAAEAADNAALLARQRYASGLVDFQTVLETQRSQLNAQDSVASSGAELAADHVRLYKALGGGWKPDAAATPSTTAASS